MENEQNEEDMDIKHEFCEDPDILATSVSIHGFFLSVLPVRTWYSPCQNNFKSTLNVPKLFY